MNHANLLEKERERQRGIQQERFRESVICREYSACVREKETATLRRVCDKEGREIG
jgi:hypothetical protein